MKIVFKAVGPVGLAALPLHVVLGPRSNSDWVGGTGL